MACDGVCWEELLGLRHVKETSWTGWMSGFVQGSFAIMPFDGSEIGPTEANNEGEQKIPGRHRRAGSDLPLSRGDAGR